MVDHQPTSVRRLAQMLRLERRFAAAVERAFQTLLATAREQLGARLDTSLLDERAPAWLAAVAEHVEPEVLAVYLDGMRRQAAEGTIDAQPYAARYLESVHSRLVGTAAYAFDTIREELLEGQRRGESIPELAARVDTVLADSERWRNRAVTIARTEVLAANSAGAHQGAGATADLLGVDRTLVAKAWLDTNDARTRPTHRHAAGQMVMGLDALFTVGEARMPYPGFVSAPADETICCRCSVLYLMPGDPGYPTGLTAGGPMPDPRRAQHRQSSLRAAANRPGTNPDALAAAVYAAQCGEHPCVCTGCDEFDCRLEACACCWTYDEADTLVLSPQSPDDAKMEALAAAAPLKITRFDVSRMPPKLQAYWLSGPGAAKIGYGAPGQFKRCQAALRGKVPGHEIDGTCANLIHQATGEWPGKHGNHAAGAVTFAADMMAPMVEPPPGAVPAGQEFEPEDEDPPTGAIVALLPAADEDVQGIGPEVKHATVLYLGEVADLADDDHTALATLLQEWAGQTPAETSQVTGMDTLGDDGALVWLLDDSLAALRDALASTPLVTRLLAAGEQFPNYLPHVTVGYPTNQGDSVDDTAWPAIENAAADVTQVRFDRVALWWGESRAEWPLTGDTGAPAAGEAQSAPDTQEAPVTAAATETQVQADAQTTGTLRWTGVLAPEGIKTGDKRKFADGAILWMGTPGVLKAMFADKPGHDDSVPVGLIESIERTPDGMLPFHGTWDTGDNAVEARRQNIAGLLRGVSVDLDDVEFHLEDAAGNVIEGDAIWELEEEPTFVVDKGRVRSATLWCIPAFVEAYVLDETVADQIPDTSIVTSTASPLAMAASAAFTETNPDLGAAPAAVFANPGLTEPTKLTVTDDGRVFGHLACWGVCHIGIDGACVTPPHSEADYAYFATGVYATSDGEAIPVGTITMGTGHADLSLGWRPTVDHYDNTGTAAAYVNMGEDEHGIWFAGTIRDDLPLPQRRELTRAGSVSGDWRGIGGSLELVAALGVNVAGFPIPSTRSRVAAGAPMALVASGVVPAPVAPASTPTVRELAREVAAYQARQARLDATRRRLRRHRQAALASRLTGRN